VDLGKLPKARLPDVVLVSRHGVPRGGIDVGERAIPDAAFAGSMEPRAREALRAWRDARRELGDLYRRVAWLESEAGVKRPTMAACMARDVGRGKREIDRLRRAMRLERRAVVVELTGTQRARPLTTPEAFALAVAKDEELRDVSTGDVDLLAADAIATLYAAAAQGPAGWHALYRRALLLTWAGLLDDARAAFAELQKAPGAPAESAVEISFRRASVEKDDAAARDALLAARAEARSYASPEAPMWRFVAAYALAWAAERAKDPKSALSAAAESMALQA
jgi:hypothetical protein